MYTHAHIYVNVSQEKGWRRTMTKGTAQRKKCQEEGRVRQWTEVRCQKGESKTGYKPRTEKEKKKKKRWKEKIYERGKK